MVIFWGLGKETNHRIFHESFAQGMNGQWGQFLDIVMYCNVPCSYEIFYISASCSFIIALVV